MNFKEYLVESSIGTSTDPIREIGMVLDLYDEISKDRYKISNMAKVFYYSDKKDRLKFVINTIYNYGFEKYPLSKSQESQKIAKKIFNDTDNLDNKSNLKDYEKQFNKILRETDTLIKKDKIEGYNHIEDILL